MAISIKNLENGNRKIVDTVRNFSVLEFFKDCSVAPENASMEYFMSEMGVHRRQVLIEMDGSNTAILQAGAMQWIAGDIQSTTGIKSVGNLLGKAVKSAVTKETVIKPEYQGVGTIALEPTYKYIILEDVSK